jgi:two-component system nitrogen regulation sensor histidine kinase GlnL
MKDQVFSGAILDSVPNPMFVVDGENAVVYANSAAENFFQTSSKSLARKGVAAIIPATSPVLSLLEDVRKSGATINEHEVVIGTPRSGGERVSDLQIAPVSEHRGFILLQVLQRSMAQKIDRQLTHRSAARTVTGMAEMLAHEIKNPLSGIRGAAQLLESNLEAEDVELTELIVSETDRIRDLVNQMEEFSDERPIKRSAVNIHAVLSHVCKIARNGFARDIAISEIYDPSLPPVLGDRDQLVQVLINLVKNAAEAIEESGTDGAITLSTSFRPGVHLSMRGRGQRVALPLEVKVANSGPEISQDILPHLFDPFVSSKPNGKGLGLALTAKIVGDHGGVIECGRKNDQTVFTILLPMSEEEGEVQ